MNTRNRRFATVSALAFAVFAIVGCDSGLTEVNQNPNSPEDVPVENLFMGGVWDVLANSGNRGAFGQWTQLYHGENWAQHLAQPVYNDEDKYTPRPGIPQQLWEEMYFALQDLKATKDLAEENGQTNIWAAAEVMQVYGFAVLTDYFGDIPYTEALSLLEEEITSPAYDAQSEIYPDLISRLQAAAAMFDPSEPHDFSAYDHVYQGDIDGWRRFANSLILRLSMRLSNTSESGAAASAFQSAWNAGVFTSNANDAEIEWAAQQPASNPVYEGIILSGRSGDFRMSSSLIDRMADRNDPRLAIYAEPAATDGEYRGLRNGLEPVDYTKPDGDPATSNYFSTIGSFFLQPDAPSWLLSYAEVLFLGAEAAELGWIGDSAADLYADGVEAALAQFGIEQSAIDAYLAQPNVAYTGVEDIHLQKWMNLFLAGPEAFSDMRRIGFMDLDPAEGSVLPAGEFPSRLYYPPTEELYNADNFPGEKSITEDVWWMGG